MAAAAPTAKLEGRRLYLSEAIHFRLRMVAYQRGRNLSEVAEELLDKALPKWDVSRVGRGRPYPDRLLGRVGIVFDVSGGFSP